MTAHMIQPPDQVDDIIQREYHMSQFPTLFHQAFVDSIDTSAESLY